MDIGIFIGRKINRRLHEVILAWQLNKHLFLATNMCVRACVRARPDTVAANNREKYGPVVTRTGEF